jgi:secretion/DNA translocation related TadE-like protein
MVAVSLVAASTSAQHQAQAAADLAALAGAQALIDGLGTDQACAAATRVAAAMEADLTQCAPLGASDLRAQADIWVNLGMLGARAARASAVAGLP